MGKVKIENLNNGSAMEMINEGIKEVAADLSQRPDVTGKRTIVAKIEFTQKDEFVSVAYDVEVKTPKANPRKTAVFLGANSELVDRMEFDSPKAGQVHMLDRKSAAAGEQ